MNEVKDIMEEGIETTYNGIDQNDRLFDKAVDEMEVHGVQYETQMKKSIEQTLHNQSIQEVGTPTPSGGESASTSTAWDYYNTINAVVPDRRKHTGTSRTLSDRNKAKKAKRRAQRKARKASRK